MKKKIKQQPDGNTTTTEKKRYAAACLLVLLAAACVSFSPALKNGFTNWDDQEYVAENNSITSMSPENINRIFTTPFVGIYVPLAIISYSVEYHYFKLKPFIYHLTNLVFHLLNCLLVFWVFYLLTGNNLVSFLTALLFGIHPLHVESVAWVSERKDVLYAFFFLFSSVFYLYYRKKSGFYFYLLALVSFMLSLLSKSMAITLPVALLLVDYKLSGKIEWKNVTQKIPFFLLSFISGLLTVHFQKVYGAISQKQGMSFLDNIVNSIYGLVFYIWKMILPVKLSSLYLSFKEVQGHQPWAFPLSVLVFIILIALVSYSARYTKKILFGFLFYLVTILPVIQLIPVGEGVHADRYTYIPIIGLFYVMAEGAGGIFKKFQSGTARTITGLLVAACALALSILTWNRCKVWQNSLTLWQDVIKTNQSSLMVYMGRGNAYRDSGDYDRALPDYEKALQINPHFARVYYNRGNTYFYKGEYSKAISDYSSSIELDPRFIYAYYNRGSCFGTLKVYDRAISDYSMTISMNPGFLDAYLSRGIVYYNQRKYAEAIDDFTRIITLNPGYSKAYYYRAMAYRDTGQNDRLTQDLNTLRNMGYKIDSSFPGKK